MAKIVNDPVNLCERHGISGFRCRAWSHCAIVGVDASVGSEVEVWVVELPIEVIYWNSSFASIMKHTKYFCGCSHITCSSEVIWYEHSLFPFPVYAAFPHAEYYGNSVAIGVATRRRSRVPVVTYVSSTG